MKGGKGTLPRRATECRSGSPRNRPGAGDPKKRNAFLATSGGKGWRADLIKRPLTLTLFLKTTVVGGNQVPAPRERSEGDMSYRL